jgi:hypothetical protein
MPDLLPSDPWRRSCRPPAPGTIASRVLPWRTSQCLSPSSPRSLEQACAGQGPLFTTLSRARSLPAQDIRAVGRVDSSGTTSLFTSYLSFASEWTQGNRTLVAFPACVTRVKGSDGMASAVRAAPYSLGRGPSRRGALRA